MSSLKVVLGILAAGLMLSGCMQATTYEATNTTNFKPRDKELLAKIRYTNVAVAEPFRRAIVEYHRKELPGSIVVDSDNHYLYYVLDRPEVSDAEYDRLCTWTSVGPSTDFVVVGTGPGSKLFRARRLAIPLLTEAQFREIVLARATHG